MKHVLIFCATLLAAAPLSGQIIDIGAPPGKLVDIGGRRLHLHCTGSGSPTVVLEAGASAFAIDWALVQHEIAKTNRVCSYDRAGSGWSDPVTEGSRGDVALDLHAALQAGGEKPPYVMVGASMGGLYVRLYQDRYPDEVVGMVLLDPSHEDRLFTMFEGKGVTIASLTAEQYRSVFRPGPVRVPRRSPQTGAPFDRLPRELYERRIVLDRRLIESVPEVVPFDAVISSAERERARLARLREIGLKNAHPFGDRPLVVLSRGVDSSQEMRDVHASAARLSTNSRHTVVAGAGHEIHLFEPPAVIQAIMDVVVAGRDKSRLPAR